jgi:hypothetical protein
VGLSSHLKGWFWDFFGPGRASDMRGLRDEYVGKYGIEEEEKEGGVTRWNIW